MKVKINYLAILTFYVVAITIRYITNKTGALNGIENEFLKVILQATGPAIAALITFKAFKIKPVMTLKGNFKDLIFPFVIFWGLPLLVITLTAYFVKGTLPYVSIFAVLVYGLFEELGWRGFLYQALKPLPKIAGILIVALLWFIWHLNFELTNANLAFFGILVLASWGIGKVADRTNSLLAVAAFHSLNNFFPALDTTKTVILGGLIATWILVIILKDRFEKEEIGEIG